MNNTVSVIDTATNTVLGTIAVGPDPVGVAVNSNGNLVYVANNGSNTVSVIDTTQGLLGAVTATITVGTSPYGVAVY